MNKLKANFVLLFVVISWGITFPLIEDAMHSMSPFWFVAIRFALAAVVLIPFLYRDLLKTDKMVLLAGLVMGLLNSATYLTQTIGLQTTTAAQAAFITGVNVILVPFMLPFFKLGRPKIGDIIFALISLLGLYILTGADVGHLHVGAVWILVCAFFAGLTIVYLQKVSSHLHNLNALAFYQIAFTVPLALMFAVHEQQPIVLNHTVWIALLVCGVVATSIALLMQTKYQRYTTATNAALIFCLEPVFGALFGYLINGEPVTSNIWIGGALMSLSIICHEMVGLVKKRRKAVALQAT